MVALRVQLTGRLGIVTDDGQRIDGAAFPGRQGRLVFAALAASRTAVPRDELAEMLWPTAPRPRRQRDLSVLVSKLRSLLRSAGVVEHTALSAVAGCYELRLPEGSVVDVHAAAAHAAEAERALRRGEADQALAAALAAAEVARRPLLPGEQARWISEQRQELERIRLVAVDVAAEVLRARGEVAQALTYAHEAVELAPFRESGYAFLMRLQLAAGDRAEALRTYERCRRLLADELGVDPAAETEAVYLDALRSRRRSVVGGLPAPDDAEPRGNLPTPVTSFVGREQQIGEVAAALEGARLVTLCGVGGVGKSRLALECARRLAPAYVDGAWQCELARIASGDAIAHALAGVLGVHEQPDRTLEGSLVDFLRPKQLLLLVDNCEHVLDELGPLLETILHACPRLAVLATSRERLALDGEHVLPVEPLPVPAPGAAVAGLVPGPAMQLFCDRAAAACHGFSLAPGNEVAVADICRRLDGLPLAIELAVARLRTVTVTELAARLDERFDLLTGGPRTARPRQRTLRGMVDWSYALLDSRERRVFDHLSVFAGSCTVQAAAAVCADAAARTEEALAGLVNRSMIVMDSAGDGTRYRLLETLRIYGRERLAARRQTDAARRRHAVHHVTLAESAADRLRGPDEALAAAALEQNWDELREAHRWSTATRDVGLALRLAAALYWYALFYMRPEAPAWAEQATDLPGADTHPLFPLACATAGVGCWGRGDLRGAGAFGNRGLQAAHDRPERRFPLDVLGAVALFEGVLDRSVDHFTQGADAAAAAGDGYHRTHLLGDVALVRAYQGHADEALQAADEARRIARATANPSAMAWSLYVDGEISAEGDPDRALALLDSSIALARSVGIPFVLGVALVSASSVRCRHGDPRRAVPLFLQVVQHWHRLGNWTQQWTTMRNVIELFVRLRADVPAAVLLGAQGVADTAAPPFGTDAGRITAACYLLQRRLGPQRFAAAKARGETMTGDEAVNFACAELRRRCAGHFLDQTSR